MGWLSDRVEKHLGANVPVKTDGRERGRKQTPPPGALRRRSEKGGN